MGGAPGRAPQSAECLMLNKRRRGSKGGSSPGVPLASYGGHKNMVDYIVEAITGADVGKYLATFIISMIPVIELRGAIPIGVGLGLTHIEAMAVSVIGNMLPVPFIILFIRPIFKWMTQKSEKLGRLARKLEAKAEGKWDRIHRFQFFALTLFVAIPLPGTGAWTGALIAAVMNMRLRNALPSVLLGVVIAGILVTGLTYGFTSIFV